MALLFKVQFQCDLDLLLIPLEIHSTSVYSRSVPIHITRTITIVLVSTCCFRYSLYQAAMYVAAKKREIKKLFVIRLF